MVGGVREFWSSGVLEFGSSGVQLEGAVSGKKQGSFHWLEDETIMTMVI